MARRATFMAAIMTTVIAAGSLACLSVAPAMASDVEQLTATYNFALEQYDAAVADQEENSTETARVVEEIEETQAKLEVSHERLDDAVVAWYKSDLDSVGLLGIVLGSESFTEALNRYDAYMTIQEYCAGIVADLRESHEKLEVQKGQLEEEKAAIEQRVADARVELDEAERALESALHFEGSKYHQLQGNSRNCGATSFAVGVNILLGENRYTDNVAVWKGAGFECNSTINLGSKGATWLAANGLGDVIGCASLSKDIHTTAELKAELEEGHVVILSSGTGSVWQRADGTAAKGEFPSGHWVVFYCYKDGIYYCNDSSVKASKGAGCPYTEAQMQQWLDGRSNHFATVLWKR